MIVALRQLRDRHVSRDDGHAGQEKMARDRREAERRYEESLEQGDAPVMLESHADGLHTANIGDLKPGDEIVLECRFAQLLSFEQGRLRVSIPTTVAPRYGHAGRAGLQAQQVPLARLDAEYPLALTLTRQRQDPTDTTRVDEEQGLERLISLPSTRSFAVDGDARLYRRDPAHVIDEVLGRPHDGSVTWARASGSRPSVGSSRIRTSGSWRIACASPTRRR